MSNLLTQLKTHPFETALSITAATCTVLFIGAVAKSFRQFHAHRNIQSEKKSPVRTSTMFLFFFLYLYLIQTRYLQLPLTGVALQVQQLAGAVLLVFSTAVNIMGRHNLGRQWGDQIRFYDNHTFVHSGMYTVVRHPLYASTIWALIAGSLIYNSGGAFAATLVVFTPMMHFRASQEEVLLSEKFPEYVAYRKSTGRFFPKIIRRKK